MAQTSVDWVLQYLNNVKPNEFCSIEKIKELLEQAKEMHKSDCEKAWLDGFDFKSNYKDFEDYYNKTYNK